MGSQRLEATHTGIPPEPLRELVHDAASGASAAPALAPTLTHQTAPTPVNTFQSPFRSATPDDAVTISALAVQVFLDTYATDGVRPDLAHEALAVCSVEAFAASAS